MLRKHVGAASLKAKPGSLAAARNDSGMEQEKHNSGDGRSEDKPNQNTDINAFITFYND